LGCRRRGQLALELKNASFDRPMAALADQFQVLFVAWRFREPPEKSFHFRIADDTGHKLIIERSWLDRLSRTDRVHFSSGLRFANHFQKHVPRGGRHKVGELSGRDTLEGPLQLREKSRYSNLADAAPGPGARVDRKLFCQGFKRFARLQSLQDVFGLEAGIDA